MGEDLDISTEKQSIPASPEVSSEKRILNDFHFVMSELLTQAINNPAGLGSRITGFTQTLVERYGDSMTDGQRHELFDLRDELLRKSSEN